MVESLGFKHVADEPMVKKIFTIFVWVIYINEKVFRKLA